jgi:hypothetical protein
MAGIAESADRSWASAAGLHRVWCKAASEAFSFTHTWDVDAARYAGFGPNGHFCPSERGAVLHFFSRCVPKRASHGGISESMVAPTIDMSAGVNGGRRDDISAVRSNIEAAACAARDSNALG